MPSTVNLFSGLPPDVASQQAQIAQQQMLADILARGSQGPEMSGWNQMRTVPKLGKFAAAAPAISSLASAYIQSQMLKNQLKMQQDMYNRGSYELGQAFGGGGGAIPGSAPGAVPAAAPASGDSPDAGPGVAPAQQPPMSYSDRALRAVQAAKYGVIPESAVPLLMKPYEPTDEEKLARVAGMNPADVARGAIGAKTFKDMRPGGTGLDMMTGRGFMAPMPGENVQFSGDPFNGGVTATNIPGVAQAQGQLTGAKVAATQGNTIQNVPTGGGGTRLGYGQDLFGLPPAMRDQQGAMPPQAAGQPPAPPPMPSYQPKGQWPATPASAAAALPKTGPWATMPKLSIPSSVGGPDEFTKGVLDKSATKHVELASKYGAESDLADQKIKYNSDALASLPNAEVGPLSHYLTDRRAAIAELSPSLAKVFGGTGSVAPTQELNKNLVNAALQGARSIYGARMTQNEVNLQKNEASPSAAMVPEAIKSLLLQDNIRNQYAKQRADDYGKYRAAGGDPLRFESWYSNKFPLKTYALKATTPPAALQLLQQHPETAAQFKAKFGWNPLESE